MEGSRLSDCTAAASGAVSAPAPAPAPPGQEEVTPFLPLRMGLQNAGSFFAPLLPTSLRSVRLPAAPPLPVPPSRSSFPSQSPSLSRCPSMAQTGLACPPSNGALYPPSLTLPCLFPSQPLAPPAIILFMYCLFIMFVQLEYILQECRDLAFCSSVFLRHLE